MDPKNSSSHNGTLQPPIRPTSIGYQPLYHTILLIIAILTLIHNVLVAFLYTKVKTLRNSTNLLLASLSCADSLTGFLLIPTLIAAAALVGQDYLVLFFSANVISDFVTLAIVLNLSLVTIERYIALCHPYYHPKIASKKVARLAICFIWVFAVVFSIIPLCWSYPLLVGENKDVSTYYKYYSLISLIGCFFIPSAILLFCLVSMFSILNRFVRKDTARGVNVRSGQRGQRKAVCVFFAMYASLMLCWSPLMGVRLAMDAKEEYSPSQDLLEILLALRCCSSVLNPAIYVWCKRDFKKAFMKVFFKRKENGAFNNNYTNSRTRTGTSGNLINGGIRETVRESLV